MNELQNLTGISDIGVISQAVELLQSLPADVMETLINSTPEDYARALPQILGQVPMQDRPAILDILNSLNPQFLGYMMGRKTADPSPQGMQGIGMQGVSVVPNKRSQF